jgi:hypothetical protein
MTLPEAKAYFEGHIAALKRMCPDGTPWVFLCCSVVIEYLSKIAAGQDNKGSGYKQFIRDYFPVAYREFKYQSGDADLPLQMYHVLRCGIVHSFSMIPDTVGRDKGARNRSVVMSHNDPHLSQHSGSLAVDACCLHADSFVEDIEKAMNKLFATADADTPEGRQVAGNIQRWLKDHPPIQANV